MQADKISVTQSQKVLIQLRDMIFSGELTAHQKLSQNDLAQRLGVSRMPIRNALIALEASNLITYKPNSGYVVRRFTAEDLQNAFEVRAALEGVACRQAAERGLTPDMEARLNRIIDDTARLLEPGDWSPEICTSWVDLNLEFHGTIYAASGNRTIRTAMDVTEVPFTDRIRQLWFNFDIVSAALQDHRQLLWTIANRKTVRAEFVAREHIYTTTRQIVDRWLPLQEQFQRKTPDVSVLEYLSSSQ